MRIDRLAPAHVALTLLLVVAIVTGCRTRSSGHPGTSPVLAVRSIALPGAPPGGLSLDYLAYDRAHQRVWVPAGETGTVAVIDVNDHVTTVRGFATAEIERHGAKRLVGPSSATVGDRAVYIGNRADSTVCAVDAESLLVGRCVTLDSTPDGLAYVSLAKEVWATTPRDRSITILDTAGANGLTVKAKLQLDATPEGFAVDDTRGIFYTNLEDRDRTLAIDVASRHVTRTWLPGCGEAGPRGLVLDRGFNMLVVACPDHLVVLDVGRDGKQVSTMNVGDGLDNLDVLEPEHDLYAAAARAATLTIARLDSQGGLTPVVVAATRTGARNAVVTEKGIAYLTDAPEGRILVVAPH